MTNKYQAPLTAQQVAEISDEEIDYSEIPELDEEFWQNARLVMPERKEPPFSNHPEPQS